MKQLSNKIMSIAIALLLLVSTTSWKVEKHYCLGHIVDISFFTPAEGCGMEMESSDDTTSIETENSCCSDVTIVVQGQDDLAFSYPDFTLDHQQFLAAFTHSYFNVLPLETFQPVKHTHYTPLIIVKDLQLLDAVFLI